MNGVFSKEVGATIDGWKTPALALHDALAKGRWSEAEAFWNAGADPAEVSPMGTYFGATALHCWAWGARTGFGAQAKQILKRLLPVLGPDALMRTTVQGHTPVSILVADALGKRRPCPGLRALHRLLAPGTGPWGAGALPAEAWTSLADSCMEQLSRPGSNGERVFRILAPFAPPPAAARVLRAWCEHVVLVGRNRSSGEHAVARCLDAVDERSDWAMEAQPCLSGSTLSAADVLNQEPKVLAILTGLRLRRQLPSAVKSAGHGRRL